MIRLRTYKPSDAQKIVSWCRDERTFLLWGGERFGTFPMTAKMMNQKYFQENGDCTEEDNFYPLTACDEEGIVGHFIIRYLQGDDRWLRFGWVIVDDSKRGKGYGKEMLRLGLQYAFEIMMANIVTIGVFENNTSALHCYRSVGFHEAEILPDSYEVIQGERQKIIELALTKNEYERLNQ